MTPSLPLVPAPTKKSLPPRPRRSTMAVTALPMAGAAPPTAFTAWRSARFIKRAIATGLSLSRARLRGFGRSVGKR
jgi:hypothetical protein